MEPNKYLQVFRVLDVLRTNDLSKVKPALDDLPNIRNVNWTESVEAMISMFSVIQTQNEPATSEGSSRHSFFPK